MKYYYATTHYHEGDDKICEICGHHVSDHDLLFKCPIITSNIKMRGKYQPDIKGLEIQYPLVIKINVTYQKKPEVYYYNNVDKMKYDWSMLKVLQEIDSFIISLESNQDLK